MRMRRETQGEKIETGGQISYSQWNVMAATVLLIGIISVLLFIWMHATDARQHNNFASSHAVMELQNKTAAAHLWLEEALTDGKSAEMNLGKARFHLTSAASLLEALLHGGESEQDIVLKPSRDPEFRRASEKAAALLTKFVSLADRRSSQPETAGIGSEMDERFDALFEELHKAFSAMESIAEKKQVDDYTKTTRTFLGAFLTWSLFVMAAAAGLWRLESRHRIGEEQLRKAHQELDLKVRERTAELSGVNELLRQEISMRRQTEEELAAQKQLLEAYFENPLACNVILDRDFNFLRVNETYAGAYGRRAADFPGHNLFEFHPSDAKTIFEEVVAQKKTYQVTERPFVFADHPERGVSYWDWTLISIPDDGGEVRILLFTLMEVTERCRAGKEKARLLSIIEATTDFVAMADRDGHVQYYNRGARQMLGIGEAEDIRSIRIPDTHPEWANKIILEKGVPTAISEGTWSGETAILSRDGREIPVSQIILAHQAPDGTLEFLSTIARDITERKQAEAKIRQQLDRLSILRSIDMTITASFDLRVTLGVLVENALLQLNVDAISVLVEKPKLRIFECAAGKGFRTEAVKRSSVRLGQGWAGKVVHNRSLLMIPDIGKEKEAPQWPPFIEEEGFRAYFGAPLIVKGRVLGVLEIFHRRPLQPDEEWLAFLETLAGQAGIAVDNNYLFAELQHSNDELIMAYDNTLEAWARALDYRDKETEGHSRRVTDLALELAMAMGIRGEEALHIRRGALLHDIGKLGVPDSILLKAGKLTDEEWELMKRHPQIAYELLYPIEFLRPAIDIPYCHHEKWDGSGYPRGLKGEEIPLAARIFSVIDVWDALRSHRPYRQPWSEKQTVDHLRSLAGIDFDPVIVENFMLYLHRNPTVHLPGER